MFEGFWSYKDFEFWKFLDWIWDKLLIICIGFELVRNGGVFD